MTEVPEHLRPKVGGDRGFLHMPPIPSTYGGYVRVYESSNASGPHLWVTVHEKMVGGVPVGAFAHLTVEGAVLLAQQIIYLAEHHYQLKGGKHD